MKERSTVLWVLTITLFSLYLLAILSSQMDRAGTLFSILVASILYMKLVRGMTMGQQMDKEAKQILWFCGSCFVTGLIMCGIVFYEYYIKGI